MKIVVVKESRNSRKSLSAWRGPVGVGVCEPRTGSDLSTGLSGEHRDRPDSVPHFDRDAVGVRVLYDLIQMRSEARDSAGASSEDANAIEEPSLVFSTHHLKLIAITMASLIDPINTACDL